MLGLALAGPARGSDGFEPPLPDLPAVDVAAPTLPELPPVPSLDEPPVVVVAETGSSDIDVSVRVFSPDVDEVREASSDLISPAIEVDITEAEIDTEVNDPLPDSEGDDANTNAGDSAPVVVGKAPVSGEEGGETRPAPLDIAAEPVPVSAAPPDARESDEQYQQGNYQYQSLDDTWNWDWYLVVDCLGNVASDSVESGDPSSMEWAWDWIWSWGCGDPEPRPGPAPAAPVQEAEPPPAAPHESPDATPSVGNPWNWTWTFTFCGEQRTFSFAGGDGTPLTWAWDWTWSWACAAPSAPAPAESGGGSTLPSPSDAAPRELAGNTETPPVSLPTMTLGGLTEPLSEAIPALPLDTLTSAGSPGSVEISVEVVIPLAISPSSVPSLPPFPALPTVGGTVIPSQPTTVGETERPARPSPTWTAQPAQEAHPVAVAPTHPRARDARGTKAAHTHAAARHQPRLPRLPSDLPQPRQALGSSSAGGTVPSALLFGVAALTGFVILAAPSLGRRIAVARELRPRGLHRSPIDRPG